MALFQFTWWLLLPVESSTWWTRKWLTLRSAGSCAWTRPTSSSPKTSKESSTGCSRTSPTTGRSSCIQPHSHSPLNTSWWDDIYFNWTRNKNGGQSSSYTFRWCWVVPWQYVTGRIKIYFWAPKLIKQMPSTILHQCWIYFGNVQKPVNPLVCSSIFLTWLSKSIKVVMQPGYIYWWIPSYLYGWVF